MELSNLNLNLKSLKEIQEENPATTHIILRREDSVMVDVPLSHAEMTIRRHPAWTWEGGSVPQIELAVKKPVDSSLEELPILPAKPSEEKTPLQEFDSIAKKEHERINGPEMQQGIPLEEKPTKKQAKPKSKKKK